MVITKEIFSLIAEDDEFIYPSSTQEPVVEEVKVKPDATYSIPGTIATNFNAEPEVARTYVLEVAYLGILILYGALWWMGKNKNDKIATAW